VSMAIQRAKAGPSGRASAAGDPGIFGFLGGLAKSAVGLIPGIGPIARIGIEAATGGGRARAPSTRGRGIALPAFASPGVPSAPARTGLPVPSMNGAGLQKGFHLNKSDYFLRDGTFVPAGTRQVRNRRRNALNPKALRRAVSRIDAGKVWQGKLAEISTKKFTAAGKPKIPGHHHHRSKKKD